MIDFGQRFARTNNYLSEGFAKANKTLYIDNIRKSILQAKYDTIDDDELVAYSQPNEAEAHMHKVDRETAQPRKKIEISERLKKVQEGLPRTYRQLFTRPKGEPCSDKDYTSVRIEVPIDEYADTKDEDHPEAPHQDTDHLIPDSPWEKKLPEDLFLSFEDHPQITLQFPPSCQISKHQIQELERMDPWKGALAPKKF
jgi:hypothetical protein